MRIGRPLREFEEPAPLPQTDPQPEAAPPVEPSPALPQPVVPA